MGDNHAAERWDDEESVTLKLVGAYLDGVADALARVAADRPTEVHGPVGPPPGAWVHRRATIPIGELAFPCSAVVWPRATRSGPAAPVPGGYDPPIVDSTPFRETLFYAAQLVTVSPPATVATRSSWPAESHERQSGVSLRLSGLDSDWYDLVGIND
jgi:hypothetical protein